MTITYSAERAPLSSAMRLALWGGSAMLLLIPLIAMQFTAEVQWNATDFGLFGVMLAVLCGAIEAAMRFGRSRFVRALGVLFALSAFLLVWAELAVGIFD